MKEREVIGAFALVPDDQASEQVVPAVGPFDDPAARLATHAADERLFASSPDVRHDAPITDLAFRVRESKPLSRQRLSGRRGPRGARSTTASSVAPAIHLSWTFAPVISTAIGTPRASVRTWRFVPSFARSVGLGPVWSPPLVPSRWRCRASTTSGRRRRDRRSSGPSPRRRCGTRRPRPTPGTDDEGPSRCRTAAGSPSTGTRSSVGKRCRPKPTGHRPSTGHHGHAMALAAATALRISRPRRGCLLTWPPCPVEITAAYAPQLFNMFREVL